MDGIDIATEALRLIDKNGCERLTRGRCCDENSGYTRGATTGTADAWCDPCIARDALNRMHNGEPPVSSTEKIAIEQRNEAMQELLEMRGMVRALGDHWGHLTSAAEAILRTDKDVRRAVDIARS